MRFHRWMILGAFAAIALAACSDALEVRNKNNPDRDRILRTPGDVEGLGASQFQQVISGTTGGTARTYLAMLTMAFENASALNNNGMGPRSNMPRSSIGNNRGNQFADENYQDFSILSIAARNLSTVIQRARASTFTLGPGSEPQIQRLKAWSWFVHGVAVGYLSMVYDSVGVPRPSDGPEDVPPLESYQAANAAALASFDSALVYANMATTADLPGGWLTGVGGGGVTRTRFIQIIRSYKARIRAGVARNPTERAAVNWAQVVADATNGLTSDLSVSMNPGQGWDDRWLASDLHFRDATWHQMSYYIIGMADTSGAFDTWLSQPRTARPPFLIQTPDLRFPQGADRATQVAAGQGAPTGRRYFRNRDPGLDQSSANDWRVSWYDHYRFRAFADAGRVATLPIFTVAENDMLAAEGYLRLGGATDLDAAARLINKTRKTSGLDTLTTVASKDAIVPGGSRCVPRVPQGPNFTSSACGTVFEAMKWEKRMENAFTAYGAWYFDSRGWGDLAEGTPVSWPVPYQELDARRKPIYDLGGPGRPGGAGVSSYGYGTGQR